MVCYLAGPIENAKDDGVQWRQELKEKSENNKLGIIFLDPTDKAPHIGQEIGEEKTKLKKLLVEEKWDEVKKIVSKIRHYDLRMVDTCNLLIAYLDIEVFSCGTMDEIFTAERQQKPVLIIMKQKRNQIPVWLMSFLKPEEIFESVDECLLYLQKINSSEIKVDERWIKLLGY
jgi:nucleoside 2-deoxyribosyltransferase